MAVYDLATPPPADNTAGGQTATQAQQAPQTAMSQPQSQDVVKQVAEVLLAGYTVSKTVQMLTSLLAPFGISADAIAYAYRLASRGTAAKPHGKPRSAGLTKSSDSMRGAAASEIYFRAGYIVQASRRIDRDLKHGKTIRAALDTEDTYYRQHEKARDVRLRIAAQTQRAANVYGETLGWYLNPLLNNEEECIAANGNNFNANEGTLIGYPGSVHPNCGCKAGPPHPNGGSVNDAVKFIVKRNQAASKRNYRLRRVK